MGQNRPIGSEADVPARRWPKAVLKAVISLCVLGIVFSFVDADVVVDGLRKLGFLAFLSYLAGFLLLHALSALKWRFFLSLSSVDMRARDALRCHAGAIFGNLCLPGLLGGDLFRLVLAARLTGRTEAVLLGSLVDRLADLLALLLLIVLGLVAATQTRAFDDRLPVDALTACGLILMALLVGGGLAVWILRKRSIRRYPRAVTRRLIGMTRAMRAFAARPFVAASGLFMCLLLQAAFVSLNVALGHVVGLDLDPRLWFLLWPLAKIIAMAPISFGGIGVREAAFATLVAPFASSELAVAQSLIWQCVLITGGLVCGLSIFMAKRPESGSHD